MGKAAIGTQPTQHDTATLPTPASVAAATAAASKTCAFCGEDFPTRSALFRHLRTPVDACPAPREDAGEKVMLLFGYDCCSTATANGVAGVAEGQAGAAITAGGDSAGDILLRAMGIDGYDGRAIGVVSGAGAKPLGFSQASSVGCRRCPLLAQEQGVSATADTACLRAPTTVPVEKIRTWLIETNTALAGTGVRVLGRMSVPRDLHAEAHTTRRRYEYLVPAWLFDGKADGPWTGPARGEVALIPLLKRLRELAFRPFGSCNVRTDRRRRRCPLWHNFSAEAVPHSPSAARRLFRFYAHDTVVVQDVDYVCLSVSGDAFVDRQVRGMVGLAVAGARGLIGSAEIASCIDPTRQEDLFLVPLAPVSPCWLAEVGYATWQTKLGGGVCMSPGAAQRSAPPLEGWSDETTRADAVSFRRRVIQSAAGWWQTPQQHLGAVWLRDTLEPGATKLVAELKAANERTTMFNGNPGSNTIGDNNGSALAAESRQHKLSPEELNSLPSGAPAAYQEVLRLLREADTSGLWPASTAARNSVISGGGAGEDSGKEACASSSSVRIQSSSDGETEEDEDVNNGEGGDGRETAKDKQTEEETEEEADSVQKPQRGGSFTVGAYPPPYPPPRGNKIFPALTRAAFDLEAALMPNRPPSSTIAVNRHARFRPHIDNGAGAGQSVSLIVGLGDYVGGELVVEGEEVNIRYNPLEFNGWTQRHWTRPFKGERYSLVWFTPKGCEGMTNGAYLFQEKENGPNGVAVVVDESTVSEDGLQVHEGNQQELH